MALIGYAEANYYSLITNGHYYIDRTSFIAEQEKRGNRNLLFARPRRFGMTAIYSQTMPRKDCIIRIWLCISLNNMSV